MSISRTVLLTLFGLCLGLAQTATGQEAPREAPREAPAVVPQATVNVNEADADALAEMLRGVGPRRAKRIVDYRETHGPFVSLEELGQVRGIGDRVLDWNRKNIVFE